MLLRAFAVVVSPVSGSAPLTPSRPRSRAAAQSAGLVGPDDSASAFFNSGSSWGSEHQEALTFLETHRPDSDAAAMSEAVLRVGIQLALSARQATPWGRAVPWQIFLNDVLPYAVLNEARDNWRPLLYASFMPLVQNATSVPEAALRLNAHIWDEIDVKYESQLSPHITAPLEAMAYKRASCTGLSVLLIDACRAVGIPARMAMTGAWAPPNEGNHNWVEVWVDDHWEFTGAFDGDRNTMNKTWFTTRVKDQDAGNASQHVYATTFRAAADGLLLPAECVSTGGDAPVNAIDRTAYYNGVTPPGDDYEEGSQGGGSP